MDGSESHRIATATSAAPLRGLPRRKIAIAVGIWVALAGSAIGIARALDDEPVRTPELVARPPAGLPPLRLFLDRDLPKQVLDLPTAAAQATRLQSLATSTNDPALWVDLGTLAQRAGDLPFALGAYRQALVADPKRVDAQVGVQMVDGATGPDGLARAAAALATLEAANPGNQLVAFNVGMVAAYSGDRVALVRAFGRVIELGASTPLGRLARRFTGASQNPTGTP